METGSRQDFTGNGDVVYMNAAPQSPKNTVSKIKHSRPAGKPGVHSTCCTYVKPEFKTPNSLKVRHGGAVGHRAGRNPGALARQSSLMASPTFTQRLLQK